MSERTTVKAIMRKYGGSYQQVLQTLREMKADQDFQRLVKITRDSNPGWSARQAFVHAYGMLRQDWTQG